MSVTITLDNYKHVCYPGQKISGQIECNFIAEEQIRVIQVNFKGAAKVRWCAEHCPHPNDYSADEEYFNDTYKLLEGGDNFILPPGKHVYPFSYTLPAQLSSSCDFERARIDYVIVGTVDRPNKSSYESEFYLTLCSPLDLNTMPKLLEPQTTSVSTEVECGRVNLSISVPTTGFVPGQVVNVACSVENLSNVSVSKVRFTIISVYDFIAHNPSTKCVVEMMELCDHYDGGIAANSEKFWTASFAVPDDDPYLNLVNCSIIELAYLLRAEAVFTPSEIGLTADLPIMIGTIPLTDVSKALPILQEN